MNSKLQQLAEAGQSIWLDSIRRSMFESGELRTLIDLGLRGMTSNPTIFAEAIGRGADYDAQLATLVPAESDAERLYEALAIADIRAACDAFAPLYEQSDGNEGLVSLEVSPLLSRDTAATIAAARRLWAAVDRPNVMIKIPGTAEGIAAITECIASAININVTLLFSVEQYEAAANAYLAGIERRVARKQQVHRVASVASLFVSRIDTAVDKLVQDKIARGEPCPKDLLGRIGVVTAKLVYERFRTLFGSERFTAMQRAGARVQRPLWGSTSVKNPAYPDLMYVESLVAQRTVNTMPPSTLAALLDHGRILPDTIETEIAAAHALLGALVKVQISRFDIGRKLQVEGIKKFADSYRELLKTVADKRLRLLADGPSQAAQPG
jgi:transaldolase